MGRVWLTSGLGTKPTGSPWATGFEELERAAPGRGLEALTREGPDC